MTQGSIRTETKSAASKAFAHYLRTGRRLPESAFESNTLKMGLKFNENHDPSNGQFTFGSGGSASLGESGGVSYRAGSAATRSSGPVRPPETARPRNPLFGTGMVRNRLISAKPGHQPIYSRVNMGEQSALQETARVVNPGKIAHNAQDKGGASYGTFQLSTNTGTLGEFIASPEAGKWVGEIKRLKQGSPSFDRKWQEIAVREPDAFEYAQEAFLARTHYDRPVLRIRTETGFDVNSAADATVKTVVSTTIQHGVSRGGGFIVEAIKRADRKFKRSDPGYDAALINNIFDVRLSHYPTDKARYAHERLEALLELAREHRQ